MKEHSRTYNSIVNSLWGVFASIITTILNFVVRVVLVKTLGAEINGIHSLFQSIISIMALMEMGLNTAMIIHLYAPIKECDNELIKGIIGFYRKLYRILSITFFVVGLTVSFTVLDYMVTSSIPIGIVRMYFLLFVLSFSLGYLTNYRRCIIFAEQKNRVSILATTISELICRSLQVASLIVYRNYFIFLALLVFERLLNNSICNYYVIKHFPFLKKLDGYRLCREKKTAIFSTVKPLFVNQMANTIQMSSRSVLISVLLGNVSVVGYFGNYQLIMNVVQLIYGQLGGAITSGFGNLSVDASPNKLRKAYFKSAFVMNWIAAVCCSCFICCSDTFIYLIFGEEFVLETISMIVLTANLIIYLLDIPIISLQNALGLHKIDSSFMVLQAFVAILFGYVLGKFWGMAGIFVGLLVPLFVFTFIRKGILISKHSLGLSVYEYLGFAMKEFLKISFTVSVSYALCQIPNQEYSITSLIISLLIASVTSLVLPLLLSWRQPELRLLKDIVLKRK